jgi:5S rRNA maturation endonuclease (ribonuclease M5)
MSSPTIIRAYLEERFKKDCRISSNGVEYIVPSIFIANDYKRHMSINADTGLWQCFKSGEKGNFIKLYAHLEKKSYARASAELLLKELNEEPKAFVSLSGIEVAEDAFPTTSELIPVNINSYASLNETVISAWKFLMDRDVFNKETFDPDPYYLVTDGRYKDRIIIPFKDPAGAMFFFQARSLNSFTHPKYLNPPSAAGVRARNVLYPFDEEADHLCICEGPFDAISLQLQGVNATCTVGSKISTDQIDSLKEFEGKIIIAYDNDEAGKKGVLHYDSVRRVHMMPNFEIVNPPPKYKDWNEAHIKGIDLKEWINKTKVEYSYELGILQDLGITGDNS